MNVHLSEESRRFVADQVAAGRYPSEEAVIEDALARMRERQAPPPSGRALENDPLWGMFRDEPELMDQIVEEAMKAREVEGKGVPSIEEVREALSKIPGSMAQAVIEEREDRF